MTVSAITLVEILARAESVAASTLEDQQKALVLDDILKCLPPAQHCVTFAETRAIVAAKINEISDGFKAKKTKGEKPKQSRQRKAPAKSAKA